MTDIVEKIYSTPRTYGSPTGRDHEISHAPNWKARLAEKLMYALASRDCPSAGVAAEACDVAEEMFAEFDKRGWLIEVVPAPDLDANYGKRKATP